MYGTGCVLLQMYTSYLYPQKLTSRHKRIFILAYLIALRKIRIKVVFPIKFGVIRQLTIQRHAYPKYMPYCFPIDNRQSPRVRKANWANIGIRSCCICLVQRRTEHLRLSLKLRMDFKAYCGNIFRHTRNFSR